MSKRTFGAIAGLAAAGLLVAACGGSSGGGSSSSAAPAPDSSSAAPAPESSSAEPAPTTAKVGVIYAFEMIYAGLFKIENVPQPQIEPMLLVNCPMLLFPFMRRIVADLTREGGFPPLLLDPVDFTALYMRKREQAGAGGVKLS